MRSVVRFTMPAAVAASVLAVAAFAPTGSTGADSVAAQSAQPATAAYTIPATTSLDGGGHPTQLPLCPDHLVNYYCALPTAHDLHVHHVHHVHHENHLKNG